MSSVIALVHNNTVHMMADSILSNENRFISDADEKLWKTNHMIIGACGQQREMQILKHNMPEIENIYDQTDMQFLVQDFIPVVIEKMKDADLYDNNPDNEMWDSAFLLGYNGEIYEVDTAFGVTHHSRGFAALGAGLEVAIGYLECAVDNGFLKNTNPRTILEYATKAVIRNNVWVKPPLIYESLP